MKTRTRTEVIIETDERLIIRRYGLWARAHCAECSEPGTMISLEEAAPLSGVSSPTLHCWIETDWIHFAKTADGFLLDCLNALLIRRAQEKQDNYETKERVSER